MFTISNIDIIMLKHKLHNKTWANTWMLFGTNILTEREKRGEYKMKKPCNTKF